MTVVSGSELLTACGMRRISPDSEEEPLETKTKLSNTSGLGRAEQHSIVATTAQGEHYLQLE